MMYLADFRLGFLPFPYLSPVLCAIWRLILARRGFEDKFVY
jgi:hypothetical protein